MKRLNAPALAGILVALCAGVFHILFISDMGVTDDDRFYVPASRSYALFWVQEVEGLFGYGPANGKKLQDRIDRHFSTNHEHPPFAKYVMGFSSLLFHDVLGLTDEDTGCRIGTVLFVVLCTFLVFLFTSENFGIFAGLFAALALNLHARFAFHARVPTLDAAMASMYFFTAYLVWRARQSRACAVLSGVVFGLALATKLNAPFLLLPILVFWLLYKSNRIGLNKYKTALKLPSFTLAGPSLLILGPMVFFLSWPWLWHNTLARLLEYARFHLNHYGIYFLYLGKIYQKPFAPWHAPFVMLGCTTSILIMAFASIGLLWSVFGAWHDKERGANKNMAWAGVYIVLHLLSCISVVAFFNVPKYGGIKLFLTAVPFLAVLAGIGFTQVTGKLGSAIASLFPRASTAVPKNTALAAGLVLALVPSAIDMARVHPYLLSYYGSLAGGPRGALDLGLERQYYDVFYTNLATWMSLNLPQNARVAFVPNTGEYISSARFLKKAEILRKDIQVTTPGPASYIVLTHEQRWRNYPDLFQRYRSFPLLHEVRVMGVPLLSVYKVR
ncbi:MAG: glycosyltransferase family 39 protein [Deltaproteobacteria bacterium]|nr:glycosyltransferase family 39 protein [Deltaproteobacteria bacterium]